MAWLSCKSDEGWKWFWLLFIVGGLFQCWPWVARYSKHLVFDAILYDTIGIISWVAWLLYFSGTKFSLAQWIGTFIVFIGLGLIQNG